MNKVSDTKKIPVYGITEFSEGDHKSYFYSNDLPTHLKSHQFVNAPHKHSTYITILFTKGKGKHNIDFDSYTVKPGSVFLLSPGQVHSWTLSNDVDGFVFFHTKEYYDSIFLQRKIIDFPFFYLHQNYPLVYLPIAGRKRIENLFSMINHEFNHASEFKNEKIGSLIDLVYLELAEFYHPTENIPTGTSSNYLKVKKLQKLIDENYKIKKFPNEYADMMNISIRHLNRICQEYLNKTTGDLIFERMILEAKRMLIHNDVSINKVAEDLGYEDSSYFVRIFKKKTGDTPKEFQMKLVKPFKL